MGTKVLITGVAGFIGSNLSKMLLNKGFDIIGIDNLSSGTLENIPSGVDFHQLDIRAKDIYPLFKEVDTVFHLAAKNCLLDCFNNPLETSDINVTGTVNVLEAAKQAKVRKFIYADTSAEYEGILDFPSKVDTVCPIGTYAISKSAGLSFCKNYQKFWDMNITILRYFNVYGPVQDWRRVIPPVMSSFIIKLLKGENPIIYGTGEKRRDFIYVDDVNEFHILSMQNPATDGNIYNVGSGVNHSVNEVFEIIEGILKTGLKPIYKDDLPGEAEVTLADISESIKLGWKPEIEIEEGIKRSIEYIREKVLQ
ncbi:MAG: NAD-dependent epimerase/dehydratase family protein [bacterium]